MTLELGPFSHITAGNARNSCLFPSQSSPLRVVDSPLVIRSSVISLRHMLFKISSLVLVVVLAAATVASPIETSIDLDGKGPSFPRSQASSYASLNPPIDVVPKHQSHTERSALLRVLQLDSRSPSLTNGQRLRARLPLKPPQGHGQRGEWFFHPPISLLPILSLY